MSDGVDVILDLWDLKEGQDKYAFMERMVTDASISKVLAVCDREYAEKANSRKKGVGMETQIMSKEIYDRVDQRKFAAIVTDHYSEGAPCLPTFFSSRKYIDMSSEEKAQGNYEQLLRFIFDRPLHQKPMLGIPPSHIFDERRIASKTASKLAMIKQAIIGERSTVPGLISDYLVNYSDALDDFRIGEQVTSDFDEKILNNIISFIPYRDEYIDLINLVANHRDDESTYQEFYEFFQGLLRYLHPPNGVTSWNDVWFDNYRFILFELFIYTIAVLIKKRKYQAANLLLSQGYFDEWQARNGPSKLGRYCVFDRFPVSLEEFRKVRLHLSWISVTAQLMKERASRADVCFDDLVETDFVLFLRCALNSRGDGGGCSWRPRTAPYAEYRGVFQLFAKASAKRVFEQLCILIGVDSKVDLESKLQKAKEQGRIPNGGPFAYPYIDRLINLEFLDSSQ